MGWGRERGREKGRNGGRGGGGKEREREREGGREKCILQYLLLKFMYHRRHAGKG